MTSNKKVFIIGPGFIGWNVLDLLIASQYTVTALVRRSSHATQITSSGATPIIGDLHDHDLIAQHTADADITIHTATADDLPSVQAVIDGVRQRARAGKESIYIHTSGTSVLDDGALGAFKGERIYSDDNPADIDTLPDEAPHREEDLTIVRARLEDELKGKAKMVIMTPPEIYGYNPGHKRLSIQVPTVARFALKHGWAPHVGDGLSVESQIHVLDLARAYITILKWMEGASWQEVAENPYFYCENGKEFSWKEVAEEVAKSLHGKGLIKEPLAKTVPRELWKDLFGDVTGPVIGLNSRSRAVRLRKLGWEPREKGIWESWNEDELPELLKEEGLGEKSAYGGVAA